jgi:hypothetical protein
MAFPTVAAVNGGFETANDTNHIVNLPSGIAAGDLLLVFFSADGNPTITLPGGWNQLFQTVCGSAVKHGAWYRVADGTEGASITVTTTASEMCAYTSYRIIDYAGTPELPTAATGTTQYPNPPSLTPSWGAKDTLWFACYGNDNNKTASGYPTNYGNGRNDVCTASTGSGVATARRELNAASEDPGQFTMSAADDWVSSVIAVKPSDSVQKSSQVNFAVGWTSDKVLDAAISSQPNWPLGWTPAKALDAALSSQVNYSPGWTSESSVSSPPEPKSSEHDYPLGWTPDKALDAALSSEKSWPLGWTPAAALDAALSSQKDYTPGWTSESSVEVSGAPIPKQSQANYPLGWTSKASKGNIVWKALTDTLLAAQKKPHRTPYVEARVYDYEAGIKRLSWASLYEGTEPDNHHGIAFDGQGSMYRIRSGASSTLLYQKITNPGPSSDFSQWTQIATDCYGPCAIASYGAKVYIFYRTSTNVLWKYYSHDYGQSWDDAQLTSDSDVLSLAACWKGTTDIVVCFAATSIQIIAIVLDTTTQTATPYVHNHALDTTYGIGATFRDGQFPIIFAASDTVGDTVLYALYASQLSAAYNFLAPYPLLTAHDDQNTIFTYPDCHSTPSPYSHEILCLTAVESYSGITSYTRPLFSHLVKDTYWSDATIIEPKFFLPAVASGVGGLRLTTDSSHWWLSMPGGLWRASREADSPVDLSPYIIRVRHLVGAGLVPALTIELDNSRAHFLAPPPDGREIVLRLGYKTTAGPESVNAGHYWIDSSRFTSSENTSVLIINATDIWGLAARWTARYVLRWNYTSPPVPYRVWAILYQLLGRFGIPLHNAVAAQSYSMDNFYPKFLVRGGSQGHTQVRRLLSFVTDGLIQREAFAFVKDLLPTESPCYEYRNAPGYHPLIKGEYDANLTITHTQVSGETEEEPPTPVREAAFDWDNLLRGIDTLVMEYDPNLEETDQAAKRAVALLRHEAQKSLGGQIIVPTNCGQELYDVVSVTDTRVPLGSKNYRVLVIQTDYDRRKGIYTQRLALCAP